ncbi:hypothetical protein [Rhizobium sp. No.120]
MNASSNMVIVSFQRFAWRCLLLLEEQTLDASQLSMLRQPSFQWKVRAKTCMLSYILFSVSRPPGKYLWLLSISIPSIGCSEPEDILIASPFPLAASFQLFASIEWRHHGLRCGGTDC